MSTTAIEWATHVWNPVTGCTKVSAGCKNCYAERMSKRLAGRFGYPADEPFRVTLHHQKLKEPEHWRKPRPRVFVNSMSDLFHEDVPPEFIWNVFRAMAHAPRHKFLILTKRPHRMRELVPQFRYQFPDRLDHVWLGVSAEDQSTADERIPLLLDTPASVRFVSCEPLLGPVVLEKLGQHWLGPPTQRAGMNQGLDWVIVGGESGPGAREMHVDWARALCGQCRAAGVKVFVKQMGKWIRGDHAGFRTNHWLLEDEDGNQCGFAPPIIGPRANVRPDNAVGFSLFDSKGANPREWPEDLRVQELPA